MRVSTCQGVNARIEIGILLFDTRPLFEVADDMLDHIDLDDNLLQHINGSAARRELFSSLQINCST